MSHVMGEHHRPNRRRARGKEIRAWAAEYGLLTAGAFFVALAFNLFLNPNGIATGGVSGISTVVEAVFGVRPAITQWALNIPLFLAGVLVLGGQFGFKTLYGTLVLPLFVLLTDPLPPLTRDPLLAAVFGGVGVGIGLGLVFKARASTGGTDVAAQILHKFTRWSLGLCILLIDGLVVLTAAVVFGPEGALHALVGLFVTGKTIDLVQMGMGYAKMGLIISRHEEAIRQAILHELDRGVTRIPAVGGYSGRERPLLLCVVHWREVPKLKELVAQVDPEAFVIVTEAHEVLGEGFQALAGFKR